MQVLNLIACGIFFCCVPIFYIVPNTELYVEILTWHTLYSNPTSANGNDHGELLPYSQELRHSVIARQEDGLWELGKHPMPVLERNLSDIGYGLLTQASHLAVAYSGAHGRGHLCLTCSTSPFSFFWNTVADAGR